MGQEITPEEKAARVRFFHGRLYPDLPWWLVPGITTTLYLCSVLVVLWTRMHHVNESFRIFVTILIGIWTIGLPTILFLEYFFMARMPADRLPDIETFKYSREMARNFWIGAVAILIALLTGRLPGVTE